MELFVGGPMPANASLVVFVDCEMWVLLFVFCGVQKVNGLNDIMK